MGGGEGGVVKKNKIASFKKENLFGLVMLPWYEYCIVTSLCGLDYCLPWGQLIGEILTFRGGTVLKLF